MRVGEASNPGPPSDRQGEASSDDEPLLAVISQPVQPVPDTLPTQVDSDRLLVDVPVRNVRPRLRSVSPTILDALEDDLDASAMSTVPASSLAIRCLGRDRTHVDRETMDDPTVEAPQLQDGQIVAGPTQCDSAVSMPAASVGAVRRLVLVSSAQSHGRRVVLVPQSSALHGLFRTLRETIQMWSPGQWSTSMT